MIWGITLEPGQAHTQVIEDEVHLSMATMESRGCIGSKADNFSHVVIKTGTTEYLLCTLVNGITYQQCLDLKLMPSDKVTFSVQGTNVVYLTGYSFASSETEQEIIQTEDWIDNPVLEGDISQDNLAYAEDAGSFQPSEVQNEVQRQHQQTKGDEVDISDREKFSVEFEVPAEEEYQYIPERVHQQVTDGTPCTSSQGQPQDHHPPPGTVAGGSGVEIKEEIHTVVETEEDIITDQPIEDVPGQSGHQSIHQPSTSAGESYSEGQMTSSLPFPSCTNASMNLDIWKSRAYSVSPKHDKTYRDTSVVTMKPLAGTGHKKKQSLYTQGNKRGQKRPLLEQSKSQISNANLSRSEGNKTYAQPQRHSVPSDGERPYQCRYCGRGFRLPTYVRAHERIHTGEKPYTCKFCPRTFRIPDHVKKHERTHTGERPYGCEYCSKRFKQRSHLREHEKTHTNSKRCKLV